SVKGEASLDRIAAGGSTGVQNGVSFSALRAEFTWQNGQLTVRDGVVKGPMAGLFMGGSNEGLFGVPYEVAGTTDKPTLRVNPISAIFPGVSRKIWDFNPGKPSGEFPAPNNN